MNIEAPNPALNAVMTHNLRLAQKQYVRHHKSRHWDIFPQDYASRIADAALWPEFRNNGLSSGYDGGRRAPGEIGPFIDNRPATRRAVTQRYQSLVAITGRPFIETYAECTVGNPARTEIDGLALNVTDLRLLHDAWRMGRLLADRRDDALRIVDIGGGFGGAATKYKRMFPKARILLFDLPEVNVAQTYYISTLFPNADILTYETHLEDPSRLATQEFDFAILPGWCIADLPAETADALVNTRSMMEMDPQTIAFYFGHIERISRVGSLFYCVNRYIKSTVGVPIRIKDYPFDDRWIARISQPAWDQPWIHELAVVRTPWPVAYSVSSQLAGLPPLSWGECGKLIGRAARILRTKLLGDHIMISPGLHHRAVLFWKRFRHDSVKWANDTPVVKATLRPLYRGLRHVIGRDRKPSTARD